MKAIVFALLLAGCGATTPLTVRCQLDAVSKLPVNDPDTLTLGQVKALATDLKACHGSPDGGAL